MALSYRIVYGPVPKMKRGGQGRRLRIQLMAAVFFLIFVLGVRLVWPEGSELLQSYLLPGEKGVTEAAFSVMITDLQAGEPLGEAVTAFCRQVIAGAQTVG